MGRLLRPLLRLCVQREPLIALYLATWIARGIAALGLDVDSASVQPAADALVGLAIVILRAALVSPARKDE